MNKALVTLAGVLGSALTIYPLTHGAPGTTMVVAATLIVAALVAALWTARWLIFSVWAAGYVTLYAAAVARPDPPPGWGAPVSGMGLLLVIELFERRTLGAGAGTTLVPREALLRMTFVVVVGGSVALLVSAADRLLETSGIPALALAGAAGFAAAAAVVLLATGGEKDSG